MGLFDIFKPTPHPWSILTQLTRISVAGLDTQYTDALNHRLLELFAENASLSASTSIETTIPFLFVIVEYLSIGYARLASQDRLGSSPSLSPLSRKYFRRYSDGLIFIVDARDEYPPWHECARVLSSPETSGRPVLCLLVKGFEGGYREVIDRAQAEEALQKLWDLSGHMKRYEMGLYEAQKDDKGEVNVCVNAGRPVKVQECRINESQTINEGLEWLLQTIENNRGPTSGQNAWTRRLFGRIGVSNTDC